MITDYWRIKMINWDSTTKEDIELISKVCKRAKEDCQDMVIPDSLSMDITAAHITCPLKLQKLLDADKGNFLHDVFGIISHIDRETGELQDCFFPRCAR